MITDRQTTTDNRQRYEPSCRGLPSGWPNYKYWVKEISWSSIYLQWVILQPLVVVHYTVWLSLKRDHCSAKCTTVITAHCSVQYCRRSVHTALLRCHLVHNGWHSSVSTGDITVLAWSHKKTFFIYILHRNCLDHLKYWGTKKPCLFQFSLEVCAQLCGGCLYWTLQKGRGSRIGWWVIDRCCTVLYCIVSNR